MPWNWMGSPMNAAFKIVPNRADRRKAAKSKGKG